MLKRAVPKQEKHIQAHNQIFEKSSNFERFKENKTVIIIVCVVLVIIIIASSNNNNSSNNSFSSNTSSTTKDYCPNWDNSPSYYDNTCWSSAISNTCLWSDWYNHKRVTNSYCDWWSTPLGRTCDSWYSPKSEGRKTYDDTSRYCDCDIGKYKCSDYIISKADNMYVNKYSQASVDAYNRFLSENCICSYF